MFKKKNSFHGADSVLNFDLASDIQDLDVIYAITKYMSGKASTSIQMI